MSPAEVAYCFIVIVFAYTLRGGTGFGAAIAMPLLALVVPMKVLVPAWSVLSVVAGIDILRRDYDKIAWADLMPLMPTCCLNAHPQSAMGADHRICQWDADVKVP